jgi:4-aminobutyrate aminotransferase / (S)-3-amino-2-methylpropionate transaminase / 5-aminovalerate transaminase
MRVYFKENLYMSFIIKKTEIPGPNSKKLVAERDQLIARGVSKIHPIFTAKAKGATLEDVDGNVFLDFSCGIGVTNIGHSTDIVKKAINEQTEKFLHTSFNVAPYEIALTLAKKLIEITPGKFPKKIFFANSGAEVVENAIKIARAYTKRQAIICFDHAFHGRTYMAMSLTSKANPYRYGFDPFCGEVYRAGFPYTYRATGTGAIVTEADRERVANEAFAKLEEMINYQITPEKCAAIIMEPVLGEGGFLPVPVSFFKKVRELCTKHGIVLIADEIQSGFGRTGSMFACSSDQLNIEPDMMTMAKGLGGGLPISALMGRAEIMDAAVVGSIGGTYGGNPLSCATALAVINEFQTGKTLSHAKELGKKIEARLMSWREKYEVVGDVRGLGPMLAFELVKDKKSKEPHKEACGKLAKYCLENGVIILTAGSFANTVRLLMPLNTTFEQLEEGMNVIEAGIKTL